MSENPWLGLPTDPPYILPEDKPHVLAFNKGPGRNPKYFLHIDDILPEAFVGTPDAPVVLLSNNPGYGKGGARRQQRIWMDKMRKNLIHEPSEYPFCFLDPTIPGSSKWWEVKLKHLLGTFGREVVARSVLNLPYFPYTSQRFGHRRLRLPSQQYTFHLVQQAMNHQAVIVFMRRDDIWKEAVPGLKTYDRLFQVNNVQNPVISPRNCPNYGYERVVAAIAVAEAKRQES